MEDKIKADKNNKIYVGALTGCALSLVGMFSMATTIQNHFDAKVDECLISNGFDVSPYGVATYRGNNYSVDVLEASLCDDKGRAEALLFSAGLMVASTIGGAALGGVAGYGLQRSKVGRKEEDMSGPDTPIL